MEILNSGFLSMKQQSHINQLTIRIPHYRLVRVIARCIVLTLAILTFPWLGSTFVGIGHSSFSSEITSSSSDSTLLSTLFRDLTYEGVLKSGDKALFISNGGEETSTTQISNQMDFINESDLERQSSIPDNTYDFIFTTGFQTTQFIDRALKTGGIITFRLSDNPSNTFQKPLNYKIIYLRKFESTVVAMRKTNPSPIEPQNSYTNRKLFEFVSEAKKEALNGLESVLLEPPRTSSQKLKKYLKRTKYLPDIMGDSLDGYPRRVFIDVGPPGTAGGSTGWFERNYPTRNRDFKKYQIETVTATEETSKGKSVIQQIGMSDWLRKNVREEEYVVMKAEAEVVEEMMNSKAIGLVDELFLECKYQGLNGKNNKSRRAYWECLALYGRLRDEGVAVHQWWGP